MSKKELAKIATEDLEEELERQFSKQSHLSKLNMDENMSPEPKRINLDNDLLSDEE